MDRTSSHSRFDPHHFRFTVTGAIRILLFGSHMHHIGLYCALVAVGYEAVVFLAVDRSIKSATTIADWSWTINVIIEMSMPALAVAFLASDRLASDYRPLATVWVLLFVPGFHMTPLCGCFFATFAPPFADGNPFCTRNLKRCANPRRATAKPKLLLAATKMHFAERRSDVLFRSGVAQLWSVKPVLLQGSMTYQGYTVPSFGIRPRFLDPCLSRKQRPHGLRQKS